MSRALARDRLGIPAVLAFILAGVAPLTVAAGVIPSAYATTGLTGIPAAFIVIAVTLALFATGYMAMARHITNAGAFYAFIARGLGRIPGTAAALVALLAYSFLRSPCTARSARPPPAWPPPIWACMPSGGSGRWAPGRSSPCWACCGSTSPVRCSAP
jgi:amino acid transporter